MRYLTPFVRKLYPSIRTRVTLPFLVMVIIVAVIGTYVVVRLVADNIQERFTNQLLDSARAAVNTVVDIEREQLAVLRSMVFTVGVADAMAARSDADLQTLLAPIASNSATDDVIVFDATGQIITRLERIDTVSGVMYLNTPLSGFRSRIGIQRVLRAEIDSVGDKFIDVIESPDKTMIYISAPVRNGESELVGGISIGIPAATVAEQVGRQALSNITLVNDADQVLGSTFRRTATDTRTDPVSFALNATDNSTTLHQFNIEGITYQALYAPFVVRDESIGQIEVALAANFIVEQSGISRNIFLTLFSILFVSVMLIGLIAARTITRPITRLVHTTRAIREGDLSRRVGLHMPDELGELSTSFDHMTESLIQRNEEISRLYQFQVQETAQRDAILTGIGDAVIVQDFNGKTILQNSTADRLITSIAQNGDAVQTLASLRVSPQSLSDASVVHLLDRIYSIAATPVTMPSGDQLGWVLVFRDITPLLEAERLKDELILQMSHELKTPLTAIRGYVELLKIMEQSSLSESGMTFLNHALRSTATLERLVNQVIDVSAVVSNQFRLDVQSFDLSELLQRRANKWLPDYQERDLELSTDITPNMTIMGDSVRIGQLVDHVLENAHHYTLPGGKVELRAGCGEHNVWIAVHDTGVGIGEDEIPKVFERMYRGRSADAGPTDARGLGLGLYLSKRIVEAHHGEIEITSRVNEGTQVRITFPLVQTEAS
jgi:signal transduction histidine kinase